MNDTIKFFENSEGALMALLIPGSYSTTGIKFLTDEQAFQQVAYMSHPKGYKIIPHYHNKVVRMVDYTCETLVIRKGVLEVVLYEKQVERYRFNMVSGDVITLYSGGHGFNIIEDVEMIEIKQGPFMGVEDKTRF